jgi:hypothetical protein
MAMKITFNCFLSWHKAKVIEGQLDLRDEPEKLLLT